MFLLEIYLHYSLLPFSEDIAIAFVNCYCQIFLATWRPRLVADHLVQPLCFPSELVKQLDRWADGSLCRSPAVISVSASWSHPSRFIYTIFNIVGFVDLPRFQWINRWRFRFGQTACHQGRKHDDFEETTSCGATHFLISARTLRSTTELRKSPLALTVRNLFKECKTPRSVICKRNSLINQMAEEKRFSSVAWAA